MREEYLTEVAGQRPVVCPTVVAGQRPVVCPTMVADQRRVAYRTAVAAEGSVQLAVVAYQPLLPLDRVVAAVVGATGWPHHSQTHNREGLAAVVVGVAG